MMAPDALGTTTDHRAKSPAWLLLAVVIGAFVLQIRAGGTEPLLWTDTQSEERHVRDCLVEERCILEGVGTSVLNIRFGTTWRDLRMSLEHVGMGPDASHVFLHVLAALAAGLVLVLANRLAGGPWAGMIALLAYVVIYPPATQLVRMLFNLRILPFLGLLVTTLLVIAQQRRSHVELFVASAVAALATEIHPACGALVVPVAVTALLVPRPARSLAASAAAFVGILTLSPQSWLNNLGTLAGGSPVPIDTSSEPFDHPVVLLTATAAALIALVLYRRDAARRGAWAVAFATLAGITLAYEGMGRFLVGSRPGPTYLLPWFGVSIAVIAAAVAACVEALATCVRGRLAQSTDTTTRSGRLSTAAVLVAGTLVSGTVALWPDVAGTWPPVAGKPTLSLSEALDVGRAFEARGWSLEKLFRDAKGPAQREISGAVGLWQPWSTPTEPGREAESAVVAKSRPGELPNPVPEGWQVVRSGPTGDVFIAWSRGWLDWTRFRVCTSREGGPETCADGRIKPDRPRAPEPMVEGLPFVTRHDRLELSVTVPILPGDGPTRRVLRMPRSRVLCAGRIVSLSPASGTVADDGLSAVLVREGPSSGAGEVTFRWQVGSPTCTRAAYRDYPPFLLEADPAEVDLLAGLVEEEGS